MPETINLTLPIVSSWGDTGEARVTEHDFQVNTDNLSPEAARRFERFAGLVDSFEAAASSGAISPPLSDALREQ